MADHPPNLRRALNYLTMTQEFWMSLLFEMKLQEVEEPPARISDVAQKSDDKDYKFTMATDGKTIFYSRKFVESQPFSVIVFALAHEVGHPMLMHLQRIYEHGSMGGDGWVPKKDSHGKLICRNPILWNMAGDFIINQMLKDSGFTLLKGCLQSDRYKDLKVWTTEKVYRDLLAQGQQVAQALSKSFADGGGCDLAEPGIDADLTAEAEEWKDRVVRAATLAKSRGTLPASIEEMVKEYTEPVYPVWLLLEQYVDRACRADDYSWYKPIPYYLPYGIIQPGPDGEQVSHVFLWYDTSGSVPSKDLARFHKVGGDIIRNAAPGRLSIGQCDARVSKVDEILTPFDWPAEIGITGRGGTSFKPPFEWMRERHIEPSLMIYLTDLEGDFPEVPPPFPVLWVSTTTNKAPFGQTLYFKERG